jgi:hypothetical protein
MEEFWSGNIRVSFGEDEFTDSSCFGALKLSNTVFPYSSVKKLIITKEFGKPPDAGTVRINLFVDAGGDLKKIVFDNEALFNEVVETLKSKGGVEKITALENKVFVLSVSNNQDSYPISEFILVHFTKRGNAGEEKYYEIMLLDEDNIFRLVPVNSYQTCLRIMEQFKNKLSIKLAGASITEGILSNAETKRISAKIAAEDYTLLERPERSELQRIADELGRM